MLDNSMIIIIIGIILVICAIVGVKTGVISTVADNKPLAASFWLLVVAAIVLGFFLSK